MTYVPIVTHCLRCDSEVSIENETPAAILALCQCFLVLAIVLSILSLLFSCDSSIKPYFWSYSTAPLMLFSPSCRPSFTWTQCVCVDVYRTTLLPTLTVNIPNANFSTLILTMFYFWCYYQRVRC